MGIRSRQSGMSLPGILAVMAMVGFFIMCIIRLAPPYFEYLSVKDIISRIVMEPETPNLSNGEIRRKLETIFNTNQIYELDPRAVEIYRKRGKTYIDASYEVRRPVLWKIDAVMNFDDLHYEVGNPEPLAAPAGNRKEE